MGTVGPYCAQWTTDFQCGYSNHSTAWKQAIYGVGGGITWDSTWESECEVQQKAAVLTENNSVFADYDRENQPEKLLFEKQHLERLQKANVILPFHLTKKF